jgi:polysaccharide biosynthesis transport protein
LIDDPRTPSQPDLTSDFGFFVATFWISLRRHWATAVGIAAVVFVATAFRTYGQPKIYQSVATLEFEPNAPKPMAANLDTENSGNWSGDSHEY